MMKKKLFPMPLIVFLFCSYMSIHGGPGNIITYYNSYIEKGGSLPRLIYQGGKWTVMPEVPSFKISAFTVDIENGFIEYTQMPRIGGVKSGDDGNADNMPPAIPWDLRNAWAIGGVLKTEAAQFNASNGRIFLMISRYGTVTPTKMLGQVRLECLEHTENRWVSNKKEMLPAITCSQFTGRKEAPDAVTKYLAYTWRLPRHGTTITVTMETSHLQSVLDLNESSRDETAAMKNFLASIQRREVKLFWNEKDGKFFLEKNE